MLEDYLEAVRDDIILVPGARMQERGFEFTEASFPGDPAGDINSLTFGLARKSIEHQRVTIFQAINVQSREVLQVENEVLLVPNKHELATWSHNDARLRRWDPKTDIKDLLAEGEDMEEEEALSLAARGGAAEWSHPELESQVEQAPGSTHREMQAWTSMFGTDKRNADSISAATLSDPNTSNVVLLHDFFPAHVRQEMNKRQSGPRSLKLLSASATSFAAKKFAAIHAIQDNDKEWAVQVGVEGTQHTLTVELEQQECILGIGIVHGQRGRVFTQVQVCSESTMGETDTRVTMPLGQARLSAWLPTPIEGRVIHMHFPTHTTVGDGGSPGIRYVELVGYVLDQDDDDGAGGGKNGPPPKEKIMSSPEKMDAGPCAAKCIQGGAYSSSSQELH
jgi:hypothetical protein